ncbi:MAG: ABC transporter ATP-binding protein [Candidatus Binataceae bacterium]
MPVEVEHLNKSFGRFRAVADLSFSIREGEIVGLLGPNGAGKSTTIHMLLGLISPTCGEIRIFGQRFADYREQILERMNFTSPYVAFPVRLTVYENLMAFARLYNLREARAGIVELPRLFDIEDLKHKPVSRLSSGESTRAGLCKAFNDPKLPLLNEPTAYLGSSDRASGKECAAGDEAGARHHDSLHFAEHGGDRGHVRARHFSQPRPRQGDCLRPDVVSFLLDAAILWGMFRAFQREWRWVSSRSFGRATWLIFSRRH